MNNLIHPEKQRKHLSRRLASLFFLFLLCTTLITGCSSDNASNTAPDTTPSATGATQNTTHDTDETVQDITPSQDLPATDATKNVGEESDSSVIENNDVSAVKNADSLLTVTFLDVGQGNSVLAECDGQYMLIDGGDREYSSFVVSYLKKQGISKLDYVVVSHYDSDHLNGIVGVLHNFSIGTILAPDYEADSKIYESYISAMKAIDKTPVYPNVGDTYSLGTTEFTVVAPHSYKYEEENDNSVGIRLVNGDNEFLLLGDASEESEWDMLCSDSVLESDVYMVSHHGSSHSSSEEFVDEVDPKYAIISVGENSYGHPSYEALSVLYKKEIPVLRTDRDGTIIAVSDGESITFNATPQLIVNPDKESGETNDSSSSENNTSKVAVQSNDSGSAKDDNSAESTGSYIGNRNSKKLHDTSCSSLPEEQNRVYYNTKEEAVSDGYVPCKRCNP